MGIGAAILGAGAIAGTAGIAGSAMASGAQQDAANTAANTQLSIYNSNKAMLTPWNNAGFGAYQTLNNLLGVGSTNSMAPATSAPQNTSMTWGDGTPASSSAANFVGGLYGQAGYPMGASAGTTPSQSGSPPDILTALQNLPGYQFTLQQGLKSTQSGAAARGLGSSGAALKGAANYATGLADSTYGNQVNRLAQSAGMGLSAANALAGVGTSAGQGIANAQIAGGNAAAAGYNGMANSVSNASGYLPLYAMMNNGGGVGGWNGGTSLSTWMGST